MALTIYMGSWFLQRYKGSIVEKWQLFQQMMLEKLDIHMQKKNTCFKELGSIFHTTYQNNWIIRPNLKQKGIKLCKMEEMGTSLVGQWLRIHLPMQGNMGSIPGWRTKIPHAEGQLSPHSTTREPTCQKLSSCKFCLRNSNLLSPVSILGMHSLPPGRPCPSSPRPPSPLLFLLHHGDPF